MVAVHGEDHALHFICLSLVFEAGFYTLTVQVGDKHVPVAAPADFRFQYVVQPVLRPVRLLQSVALDILLAASHVQTVFQGKFLADTGAAQTLVPVRYCLAVIADAEAYQEMAEILRRKKKRKRGMRL